MLDHYSRSQVSGWLWIEQLWPSTQGTFWSKSKHPKTYSGIESWLYRLEKVPFSQSQDTSDLVTYRPTITRSNIQIWHSLSFTLLSETVDCVSSTVMKAFKQNQTRVAEWLKCLPSKCEALSSNLSIAKKKKKKNQNQTRPLSSQETLRI
jgi:hypothetical protein